MFGFLTTVLMVTVFTMTAFMTTVFESMLFEQQFFYLFPMIIFPTKAPNKKKFCQCFFQLFLRFAKKMHGYFQQFCQFFFIKKIATTYFDYLE